MTHYNRILIDVPQQKKKSLFTATICKSVNNMNTNFKTNFI